jgi:hypothetical protein
MQPPQKSSSRWIFWVLGGCLVVVGLGIAAVVGVYYWGKSKLTTIVEEQTDPAKRERRAKEILGATVLPPGYHAGVGVSIGLARIVWLSDRPPFDEGPRYDRRGFIYNESIRGGTGPSELEQFLAGDRGTVFDEMGVRLRADQRLGESEGAVNGQRLRSYALRGAVTHDDEHVVEGIYSVTLVRCSDDRERWAVWFESLEPSAELPELNVHNTVEPLFAHFRLCR